MGKNHVWQFTNQRKLSKKEFIDYIERKVFRTIRKYNMLPGSKKIALKKSGGLYTVILKKILETKFEVTFSTKPNFPIMNLSRAAEETFQNILKGKFTGPMPEDKPFAPLYFLSDKELGLYAKLKSISGEKRKKNLRVQSLFEKFLHKNQDLEINIVKALSQIN